MSISIRPRIFDVTPHEIASPYCVVNIMWLLLLSLDTRMCYSTVNKNVLVH